MKQKDIRCNENLIVLPEGGRGMSFSCMLEVLKALNGKKVIVTDPSGEINVRR